MIYKIETKEFQTMSSNPNSNWIDDDSFIVIPDGTELANKIISLYPNFNNVLDADGNLIDVEYIVPPTERVAKTNFELEDDTNDLIDYVLDLDMRLIELEYLGGSYDL